MNDSTEIARVDNRGDRDVPFGYVYTDKTRVGFGTRSTLDGAEETFLCPAQGWPRPQPQDMATAVAALVADGLAKKEEVRIT